MLRPALSLRVATGSPPAQISNFVAPGLQHHVVLLVARRAKSDQVALKFRDPPRNTLFVGSEARKAHTREEGLSCEYGRGLLLA